MYKIRIPTTNQAYQIETDLNLVPGQEILVEAEQILEPAFVLCNKNCQKETAEMALADFQKILENDDLETKKNLKEKARNYVDEAQAKASRHNLEMKILDADLSFDEKKLTFYFSAENRIDFRSLVADMVGSFHKIIRLQQIGPREETRLCGGFGRCGQELCCARFLEDTNKVNADLTALQEISGSKLQKMTGCCGKLMCCLSYEIDKIKTKK